MTYDQQAYWLKRGRTYEAEFERSPRYAAQEAMVAKVLAGFEPRPRSVLEVACGFGRIGEVILTILPDARYLGTDLSPEQAQAAARRLDRPGAVVQCLSLEDLPEPAEPYDLVVAAEFLMHVPPDAVAQAIAKLKRLGRIVLTVDWDVPFTDGRAIADHNFRHDYRRLYGAGTRRIPLDASAEHGGQAIYVWQRPDGWLGRWLPAAFRPSAPRTSR
jgi:SAM-dependent methyltransferase